MVLIHLAILLSSASTDVSGIEAGGLVGQTSPGSIYQSYATGKAVGVEYAGGLIGEDDGSIISNCYATGEARGTSGSAYVGGFAAQTYDEGGVSGFASQIGEASGVSDSYSTGHVEGGSRNSTRGGFVGATGDDDGFTDTYWDTDRSGFTDLHRGAGNVKNLRGIDGLSTGQLQSALPEGFDPSIWGEKKTINGALPYLLENPPR